MLKVKPAGLKPLMGQSLAIRTHHVSSERLKKLGQEVPDIAIVAGQDDKMIDPQCSVHLGKHLAVPAHILEGKGHIIILEAELDTIRHMEAVINAGEARWAD